jgi:hypothetical protein
LPDSRGEPFAEKLPFRCTLPFLGKFFQGKGQFLAMPVVLRRRKGLFPGLKAISEDGLQMPGITFSLITI